MRKNFILLAAIAWTLLVFYLCLMKTSNVPKFSFQNIDKLAHFAFHFGFVILWILYLQLSMKSKTIRLIWVVFVSILFGILIEVLQELCTTTRSADVFDMLANSLGAIVAYIFYKNYLIQVIPNNDK